MGVVVGMLLDAECFILHLKHDTDVYVEALFIVNGFGRVGVLYISPGIHIVEGEVYSRGDKLLREVLYLIESSLEVYHGTLLPIAVDKYQ